MDVEYISLHGYIRNTPSDTEVHAHHQLRAHSSTWPVEKDISVQFTSVTQSCPTLYIEPWKLGQNRQLSNREAGPSDAWCTELQSRTPPRGAPLRAWCADLQSRIPVREGPLYVPDTPNNREGSQAREPLSAWTVRAMEKDWPKRPSDRQLLRGLKKDSDRAITPVVEAVRVPAHLTRPESPQAKQLHHLHAQLSLGQSCHRQKKSLVTMCTGLLCVRLFATR